jgi:aminopeptidase Y
MKSLSCIALCAAISGAAALRIPFLSSVQVPVKIDGGADTKPLIESSALQELISGDRLMRRAKELYEVAKLGEEEYNHPTRVIGSLGT